MKNMDNYEKMAEMARERFISYPQEEIIRRWDLEADQEWIIFSFFNETYRLRRKDGVLVPEGAFWRNGRQGRTARTLVDDTMVIYDLLCHAPKRPTLAGSWESVSSLGGIIGAGHDRALKHNEQADLLGEDLQRVREDCRRLGGVEQKQGDVSFILPVTGFFPVWFQLWAADDEFPASVRFLWDRNALQFMHYETLWYVMNCVFTRLIR